MHSSMVSMVHWWLRWRPLLRAGGPCIICMLHAACCMLADTARRAAADRQAGRRAACRAAVGRQEPPIITASPYGYGTSMLHHWCITSRRPHAAIYCPAYCHLQAAATRLLTGACRQPLRASAPSGYALAS